MLGEKSLRLAGAILSHAKGTLRLGCYVFKLLRSGSRDCGCLSCFYLQTVGDSTRLPTKNNAPFLAISYPLDFTNTYLFQYHKYPIAQLGLLWQSFQASESKLQETLNTVPRPTIRWFSTPILFIFLLLIASTVLTEIQDDINATEPIEIVPYDDGWPGIGLFRVGRNRRKEAAFPT